MKRRRVVVMVAGLLSLTGGAQASGGLFCEGEGGWVDIAMGRLIVLNVLGAAAEIDGKAYSTGSERGAGEPFIVGQAFSEGDNLMVDFVDPNVEYMLVSLRVTWHGDEEMYKGKLYTPTTSVDVTCLEGG